jgi:hypothetical protein
MTYSNGVAFVVGAGVTMLMLTGTFMLASRPAQATSPFAQQTGLPCGECHVSPAGSDWRLTPLGQRFKDNGNKLPGQLQ